MASTLQVANLQLGTRVAILWDEGLCTEAWLEGVIRDVSVTAGHLILYDGEGVCPQCNLMAGRGTCAAVPGEPPGSHPLTCQYPTSKT